MLDQAQESGSSISFRDDDLTFVHDFGMLPCRLRGAGRMQHAGGRFSRSRRACGGNIRGNRNGGGKSDKDEHSDTVGARRLTRH
jgi:hypothetical protein